MFILFLLNALKWDVSLSPPPFYSFLIFFRIFFFFTAADVDLPFSIHTLHASLALPIPARLLCWVLHAGPISPVFSRPFCLCLYCVLKAAQSSCTATPQLTIWSFGEPLNQVGCSICIRWWLREKYEDLLGSTFHSDWPIGNKRRLIAEKKYTQHFSFLLCSEPKL